MPKYLLVVEEFDPDKSYPIKNYSLGKSKKEKETRQRVLEHVHDLHTKEGLRFTQIYDKLIIEYPENSDDKKFLQNIQRHTLGHAYRRYYPRE